MLSPRVDNRRYFSALLLGLVALAWVVLFAWGQSPYGRFLDHNEIEHVGLALNGETIVLALVFVLGWTVMTVAMMLPTSLPLVEMFRTMVRRRQDKTLLVSLLLLGYLVVWTLVGLAAHLGDRGLHLLVDESAWLDAHAWIIGAGTVLGAGVYQFTPLKYHCLDKCRSPLMFITERWQGSSERAQAFKLGVDHGLFCVGCCWSLMLLMFVVGVGNIGWMLVLGAVMAIEKNMPWGRRLSAPLGLALLTTGTALVLFGVT